MTDVAHVMPKKSREKYWVMQEIGKEKEDYAKMA